MPYEEPLVARVRSALLRAGASDPREIRMFGGLCFTVAGHMCCGVTGSDLMVRVGPDQHAAALARPHTRPMDFTGSGPLRGFVFVGAKGTTRPSQVAGWIEVALSFTATLPPKRFRPTKSQVDRIRAAADRRVAVGARRADWSPRLYGTS